MDRRDVHPRAMLPVVLLAALLLAAPPAGAQEDGSAGGTPVAVFPLFAKDFGVVDRGLRLKHDFVVRNEGDADLEILSVTPT